MSSVSDALHLYFRLRHDGCSLAIDGGDLVIQPASRIDPADMLAIRKQKARLMRFVESPPETWLDRLARIRTLPTELQAAVRGEWFDGHEVDLAELTPDEIRALARDGRPYQVAPTGRAPGQPGHRLPWDDEAPIPPCCQAPDICPVLGHCGNAPCLSDRRAA
jgi:hypothetical protein